MYTIGPRLWWWCHLVHTGGEWLGERGCLNHLVAHWLWRNHVSDGRHLLWLLVFFGFLIWIYSIDYFLKSYINAGMQLCYQIVIQNLLLNIDVCETLMPPSPTWLLTLNFDLLTWKSIGIIYASRTIYLPSLKLLGQSLLELSVAQG